MATYSVQGLKRMWAEHPVVDLALTPAIVVKMKNVWLPLETKALLGDPQQLQRQAGMTMAERAAGWTLTLGKHIKPHTVRSVYRSFGIKMKKLVPLPKEQNTPLLRRRRRKERMALRRAWAKVEDLELPIVHIDETIFVLKQPHLTWSAPKSYVTSNHFYRSQRNRAVIAAMTEDGFLCWKGQNGYLNVDDYIDFLKYLKGYMAGPFAIWHDGLYVHKHQRVRNWLNNNHVTMMCSEAWTSNFNPIERGFGLVKQHYFKEKLRIGANPIYDEDGKNINAIDLKQLV
jgi:hypothetical protein